MIGKGKRPRDPNQLAKWIVDQSTCAQRDDPAHTSIAIGRRISLGLSHCASNLIWFVHISRQAIGSLRGYTKTLLAKTWSDLGPWYEVLPCGCHVPNERTNARSAGMRELKSRYPWASTVECLMFLEGFDTGELFALGNSSKSKQVSSSTFHSDRCISQTKGAIPVDMLKRQWYKSHCPHDWSGEEHNHKATR